MNSVSSRCRYRLSGFFAAFAAALVLMPVASLEAAPPAGRAAAPVVKKKAPEELAFEAAEKSFRLGKHKEALPKYAALLTDFLKRADVGEDTKALLQLRVASCHFYLQDWVPAEKALLDFLKYKDGTGNLLENGNNYLEVARVTLAQVYAKQEKWDPAIDILYKASQGRSSARDSTLAAVELTNILEERAKKNGAAAVKEAALKAIDFLKPFIQSRNYRLPEVKQAANRMVELYTIAGAVQQARTLQEDIASLLRGSPLDRVMFAFQNLEIGDRLFQEADAENDTVRQNRLYRETLSTYQSVPRHDAMNQIIDQAIEMKVADLDVAKQKIAAERPSPADANTTDEEQRAAHKEYQTAAVERIDAEHAAFMKVAGDFKTNKDYDAFVTYRMALCLLELKRPWEAYIAFRDIFDRSPDFSKMAAAYFYYIKTLQEIHRDKEAQEACREFLRKFPNAEQQIVGEVAVISGEISYKQGEFDEAVKQFRWARENIKTLTLENKEYLDWYIVSALFQFQEWPAARKAIEEFISHYPKSPQMEAMDYQRGLTHFFPGDYQETVGYMEAYSKKYPNGQYRPDARYRLAIAKLGLKPSIKDSKLPEWERTYNKEVEKACLDWLADYKNPTPALAADVERQRPEIYTLLGDVYFRYNKDRTAANTDAVKKKNLDKAIGYYLLAAKNAQTNSMALDLALKDLRDRLPGQKGGWAKLLALHVLLYDWDRESPKALDYLNWILRSAEKLGKTEQEKRAAILEVGEKVPDEFILKSAEEILADAIIRNINDPKKENVEELIGELANRIARKARRAARPDSTEEKFDPEDYVLTVLKLKDGQNATLLAQARGYFTRAEVARLMRNEAQRVANIEKIIAIYKPEELSPVLLGTAAEHLISKKEYAKAEPFAEYLLEHYRDSDFADYGIAAMAEILLDRKKPKDAATLLQEAVTENLPRNKEKDIYLLLGRTRLELGTPADLDIAVKVLTDVAGRKEWRGEATAWALYYLGQVEEKRGKDNEAINLYWRCVGTRKKYGNVTVKVYLRIAELFQKKGDISGARTTLEEMLRSDNPASKQPEADKAVKLLARLPKVGAA